MAATYRKRHRSSTQLRRPSWRKLSAPAFAIRPAALFGAQGISCPRAPPSVALTAHFDMLSPLKNGGALVSTRSLKRRRHVEDGSLASLKSGPKQINADHEDLALAA